MLEEAELPLEDVHVKYEGIISKVRVIKDEVQRIHDTIYLCEEDWWHGCEEGRETIKCETISTSSLQRKSRRYTTTLSINNME